MAEHVELSLTALLQRTDEEIGHASNDVEEGRQGAEGRLAMAETRHAELLVRRDRRRQEQAQQRALSLQAVERMTSVLVLPHPDRDSDEVTRHQPDPAQYPWHEVTKVQHYYLGVDVLTRPNEGVQ